VFKSKSLDVFKEINEKVTEIAEVYEKVVKAMKEKREE